ncbi:MAG: hypothetical protein AB7E29_02815 [Xanthobacter sp.]
MQRFRISQLVRAALLACTAFGFGFGAFSSPAAAQDQSSAPRPQAQQQDVQSPEQRALQELQRRSIDEYNEAAKLPGTAGLPECVWSGRRITALLWRDDLDTARRHLDLYERFGCPIEHLKVAFRCLVRQGNIDAKAQERLGGRVHQCWVNPDYVPAAPATPAEPEPEKKQGE